MDLTKTFKMSILQSISIEDFNTIVQQTPSTRKISGANSRGNSSPGLKVKKTGCPKTKKATTKKRKDKNGKSELEQIAYKFKYKPQGKTEQSYKLNEEFIKLEPQPEGANLYECVRGFIPGETSENLFYKVVCCGKETCPTCGKDYSISHNRRVNRAFKYMVQLSKVGYLVVTVPEQLREEFNNKEMLNKFRTYIRRKLKHGTNVFIHAKHVKTGNKVKVKTSQTNFNRGLIRWHWAGDDNKTFKPHLNILLDAGYLSPALLENFRQDVAQWFYNEFGLITPGNIYYAYTTKPEKIKHWLKYVLRSTARKITDPKTCETINRYRNTVYFGKFNKDNEVQRDSASAILSGCDPETGEVIKWSKMIKPGKFFMDLKQYAKKTLVKAKEDMPEIDVGVYVIKKSSLP